MFKGTAAIPSYCYKGALAAEAVAQYQRYFNSDAIRAANEGFRATATVDLIQDKAGQERKITCLTPLLWSETSWRTFDILGVWRSRAEDVRGVAFECGHFLPEGHPERTAAELIHFLS